jgi:hypothetical protein
MIQVGGDEVAQSAGVPALAVTISADETFNGASLLPYKSMNRPE